MIKKKFSIVMASALALVIMAFSGSAFAQGLGVSMETGALENVGDAILFSYYDIRTQAQGGPGLTDNYFTIVNTDGDEWVQAHVRVRTGQCSVELLDFDILLSPMDVFTFNITQGIDGSTIFASCDTKTLKASGFEVGADGCLVYSSNTPGNTMLSLIEVCGNCPDGSPISSADALGATRWGYVEVIGEVELEPVAGVNCTGAPRNTPGCDICTKAQLDAGEYTAWSWYEDGCPVSEPGQNLFGRVYYATFNANANVVELATANGLSLNDSVQGNMGGWILHRPCYSDLSERCTTGDGELENPTGPGYAYDYAKATVEASSLRGASDMNMCYHKNRVAVSGYAELQPVINRVGAGATFGPTLLDLRNDYGPRNDSYIRAEDIAADLNNWIAKRYAVSHYWYLPGVGQTKFAFTFPFQHFIGQRIVVSPDVRLDTEERSCTVSTGKFISPGLPPTVAPRGEVSILDTQQTSACTYTEGWLGWSLAVDKTDVNLTDRGTGFPFEGTAHPGVIGQVLNFSDPGSGSNFMAVAPMQWVRWPAWRERP